MRKSLKATAIATLLVAPFPALAATPPIESLLVVAQPSAVGSGASWDTTAPERARVEARIREYYAAVGSRNARTMYEMQTPYIRSRMSFRDYRTDWGYGEAWAAQPATKISARLEQVCYCGDWALPNGSKTRRCVLLVDAAEEETDGTVHTGKILEMWEYSGGEWYYGYPGEGDQCPAPGGEPQVEPPRSAASAGHGIATPDQARLKGRVQELQAALNVGNARATYELQTPAFRSWCSFDCFREGLWPYDDESQSVSARPKTVEVGQVCSCSNLDRKDGSSAVRCKVLVTHVETEPEGERQPTTLLELWEYTEGDWFTVFIGVPADRCPAD